MFEPPDACPVYPLRSTTGHQARTPLHLLIAPNPDPSHCPTPHSSPCGHTATRKCQLRSDLETYSTDLFGTDDHQYRPHGHHGPKEKTRGHASAGVVRRDNDV